MDSTGKKRILMISYWFAPMHSMGVKRVLGFYRYFKKIGFSVNVLTTSNRNKVKQDIYKYDEEDVEEISTSDFRTLSAYLRFNQSNKKSELKKKNRAYQIFTKLSQSFPFYFLFGEGGIYYIINAYRAAKKRIKNKRIDVVFSSYSPISDHVVSYLIKRSYPEILWIADFRDQHVDRYRKNTLLPKFQKKIDRLLLSKADFITTASRGLAQNIELKNRSSFVIYNDIATLDLNWSQAHKKRDKFVIAYTGTLYPWQSADILLESISKLIEQNKIQKKHIQFVYNGQNKSIWDSWMRKFKLESYSKSTDIVPQRESLDSQQRAAINLVLTWSDPRSRGVMTGKMFEYLHHPSPIWVFVNGKIEEELSGFLSEDHQDKAFVNQDISTKEIEAEFLKVYRRWLLDSNPKQRQSPGVKSRTLESLERLMFPIASRDQQSISTEFS